MSRLLQDLRYALRQLQKSPAFTAAVVAILALGIGATSAVFTVINAILLEPLPYKQPDRLVQIYESMRGSQEGGLNMSAATYRDLRQRNRSFQDMAAFQQDTINLTGSGDPEQIACFSVSPHFFDVLGVSVVNGRSFAREEGQPGRNTVVLLDYGLWQRRFNSDPALIGKTIELNQHPFTVIGILPENFKFYGPPRYPRVDVFIPLAEEQAATAPRDSGGFNVIGRLGTGITLTQAREDLLRVGATMTQEHREYLGIKWVPQSLDDVFFGEVRPALKIVGGAAACVFLVSCINVAGLLLVWRLRRQPEICVRMALGAGRWRVARQFLTESLLLSMAGAGAGLVLAQASFRFLASMIPTATPIGGQIAIEHRMLLFTLCVAIVTTLLLSAVFAIPRLGRDLHQGLLETGTRVAGRGRTRRLQNTLVIAEIGVAFILTTCAGLMVRTFTGLLAVDPGFHPRNVLAAGIQLPNGKTGRGASLFFDNLTQRVRLLPGVQAVAVASSLPIRGPHSGAYFDVADRPAASGQRLIEFIQVISPDYFKAMGASLREGRSFDDSIKLDSPGVIIVNQSFARKYWPKEDPLGKHIKAYNQDWQVIGVANDIREFAQFDKIQPVVPLIYFPHAQNPRPDMRLIVRTTGISTALVNALRQEVFRLDKDQPVGKFVSLQEVVIESIWSRRVMAILMSGFGVLAFLLAIVGIYGLIAYTVAQRWSEFGIHLAMGAKRADLFAIVLQDGLKTTLAGIGLGIAGALLATQLIANKLYGVGPLDPATFLAATLSMVAIATLACIVPARHIARLDPMIALRHE